MTPTSQPAATAPPCSRTATTTVDASLSVRSGADATVVGFVMQPVAMTPEKPAPDDKQLDEKELEQKLKKDQKAREKEEKKLKAKQKEAARLQAQAASDGPKKSEKKQRKKADDNENPEDFKDPDTPNGQKKSWATRMAKQYSPSVVEKSWYASWGSSGYFGADPASTKPPFVIVLSPPDVTGVLHIIHALMVAIEMLIPWRRMSGYNALWVTGVDNAGIATQDSCKSSANSRLRAVGCVNAVEEQNRERKGDSKT
ncbi:hypothetical protein CFC21_091421 [Triticum aestivum]|uniref:valine--tRNA ligase n=3 Tax=Triticum aestivum TaxID=4565 RepID=A0A3B6QAC2_WHEAT|nr:hypothetical protein CFC21_091421 [Triticum aestivum]